MKTRLSHKFFCLLLTVVMACTLLPITALAAGPSGSIERAVITHEGGLLKDAVSIDLKDITFADSVQVQLYSGETLLTTATLNTDKLGAGSHPYLTCCIATETADEYWALTPWTPKDDVVPNRAVLVVDGHEMDEKTFMLNAEDWANLPGTALPGSIERAVITHEGGLLKDAVSIDLKDITFADSVQVQLYSGETLLTTATLNTDKLGAGSHPYLTCCIATETADEYWALTPWTPKDDVVPNKAVLVVDGHEEDWKEFTLDPKEWADLPGTAFPYEDKTFTVTYLDGFSGTYATYTNLNYGDPTPVPANPYRSGYIFLGWEPSVEPTVTGDERYVAQWRYIGPQYPNPTPVQPVQPGILPPQTGDMPLWYAIARFLGLVK